jgi:photosystem II stability/assembly factor-like uncharacterized protein
MFFVKTTFPSLVVLWLFRVLVCVLVWGGSLPLWAAKKKRVFYVWEDRSDGIISLNAASFAFDPKNPKRMYAASNGVFYVSKDGGLSWWPTARFRGASRVQVQTIDLGAQLRRLKQRLLEEKLEDLRAEVGDELAQDQEPRLEREAEEEAETIIRQRRSALAQVGNRGRFSRFVYRIAVAPSKPSHVIAVTDGGAFLSTNYGRTFRSYYRGRGPGVGDVRCIAISPTNHKHVWLGTQGGLWQTKDGGKTWRRDGGMLRATPIREVKFDPHKPSIMYVAVPRSLFVSRNRGKSFLRIWSLASGPQQITTMTAMATRPTTVVVGTGSGLYGATLGNLRRLTRLQASRMTSRRIKYITSSRKAPRNLYVVNDQGVFLSRNLGKRFVQLRAGMLTPNIRYLSVSPFQPEVMWAATDYGFLRWSKVIGRNLTAAQWARFRAKIRLEPRPFRLAQKALRRLNMAMKLDKLHSRYAARRFLPQLRVSSRLYLDDDRSFFLLIGNNRQPINAVEGRIFLIEVSLVWPLGGLINPDQQQLTATTTNLRTFRDKLIKSVNRLYYARRRLQIRMFVAPPKTLPMYLRRILKLRELTAQLDVLTGGYLSRRLKRTK